MLKFKKATANSRFYVKPSAPARNEIRRSQSLRVELLK
jgi:hypothetical protein